MKQLMISLLLLLSCFSVQAQEKSGSREVTKVKKLYTLFGGISDVEGFYYCRYLVGRSV